VRSAIARFDFKYQTGTNVFLKNNAANYTCNNFYFNQFFRAGYGDAGKREKGAGINCPFE
jgi:GTPase involved in cell partitioning and DNA repair